MKSAAFNLMEPSLQRREKSNENPTSYTICEESL